jgi:hypothetical protein
MALKDADLEGCSSRSPKQRQDSGYASIGPGEESQLTRSLSLVTSRSATRVPEHVGSISIPRLLSWKDVQTRGKVDLVFHGDGSSQGKTLDPSQERNFCSLNHRSRSRCYDPLSGSRISGSKDISFRRHLRSDAEDSNEA